MTAEALEARRAYRRKWAHDHPERVKEHQARYWEKQAAARQEQEPSREPAAE